MQVFINLSYWLLSRTTLYSGSQTVWIFMPYIVSLVVVQTTFSVFTLISLTFPDHARLSQTKLAPNCVAQPDKTSVLIKNKFAIIKFCRILPPYITPIKPIVVLYSIKGVAKATRGINRGITRGFCFNFSYLSGCYGLSVKLPPGTKFNS